MNNGKLPFSIIIPVYNAIRTIGCTIDSIINQTESQWELIIIDDCSTDGSDSVIKSYAQKDSRIKYIKTTQNTGSAYQPRKLGYLSSNGKYVVGIDSDDRIEPYYLEKVKSRIQYQHADIVLTKMVISDEFSLPLGNLLNEKDIYLGRDLVRHTLNDWKIGANGCAIHSKLIKEVLSKSVCDNNLMNADEILTRQLLITAKTVAYVNAEYLYATNADSITRKVSLKLFDRLSSDQILVDLIKSEYPKDSIEVHLAYAEKTNNLINLIGISSSAFDKNDPQGQVANNKIHKAWMQLRIRPIIGFVSPIRVMSVLLGPNVTTLLCRLKNALRR